jgi:hypothetical protein
MSKFTQKQRDEIAKYVLSQGGNAATVEKQIKLLEDGVTARYGHHCWTTSQENIDRHRKVLAGKTPLELERVRISVDLAIRNAIAKSPDLKLLSQQENDDLATDVFIWEALKSFPKSKNPLRGKCHVFGCTAKDGENWSVGVCGVKDDPSCCRIIVLCPEHTAMLEAGGGDLSKLPPLWP